MIDLHVKLTQVEKLEALLEVAKGEHDRQGSEHKSVGLIAESHEKACLSLQKRLLDLEEVIPRV